MFWLTAQIKCILCATNAVYKLKTDIWRIIVIETITIEEKSEYNSPVYNTMRMQLQRLLSHAQFSAYDYQWTTAIRNLTLNTQKMLLGLCVKSRETMLKVNLPYARLYNKQHGVTLTLQSLPYPLFSDLIWFIK